MLLHINIYDLCIKISNKEIDKENVIYINKKDFKGWKIYYKKYILFIKKTFSKRFVNT